MHKANRNLGFTRRLVSQDDAAIIQRAEVPRSRFMGSWTVKTAFDAGYLIPFLVDDVLPGDHLSYDVTAYVRMATPIFPLFDNQRIDTFFFFVPNRLLWSNWAKFMGEQTNPGDSLPTTAPQVTSPSSGYVVGTLGDYLGLPTVGQLGAGATITTLALPFRAYNLIFNEWFRDENLTNSVIKNTGDGPDSSGDYTLQRRAKAHDYFTSALPWPQKFTAPTAPLAGNARVIGIGIQSGGAGVSSQSWTETDGASVNYPNAYQVKSGAFLPAALGVGIRGSTGGVPEIYADLSTATGIAINSFRQAFMIQSLLERDARGGTRYVELLKSHFGVINPDFRLQRPEYIGGGQTPLNITPIAQTTPTGGAGLGSLGAAGTAMGQHRAHYAATEHGWILGLINIRSEISYQQGIPRMWFRNTRYDYYWPAFAGLGEQSILAREIYADGSANDAVVFGYQERWHDYRTRYSLVTGIFRSTASGTLDAWHLSQKFTAVPTLNDTFIRDTPPMTRVLAAGAAANGQQYLANIEIHRTAVRPLPAFGTPVTLGRF